MLEHDDVAAIESAGVSGADSIVLRDAEQVDATGVCGEEYSWSHESWLLLDPER